MTRPSRNQLNIRSQYARDRAAELVKVTGLNATQVIEEALRAYSPAREPTSADLERRGPLLVLVGGDVMTLADTNAAIEAFRSERE